jgi:phospholipid/cholesterol/gamma-HCH transport system substrate-binding protein
VAGVGVFVVAGVLLFAVGLFMIGDRQMAFAKKVTLYTEFKKITGLQPGAVVRVSGAKAGSITQILPPDTPSGKFRVEVQIVEELHQLVRTDSLATIETEGLVGGNYLGITTGSDTAPIVAPNTVIAGKEPPTATSIIEYAKRRLPPHLVPRFVIFMEDFPRTFIGKVLRRELAKRYEQYSERIQDGALSNI